MSLVDKKFRKSKNKDVSILKKPNTFDGGSCEKWIS